MFTAERIFSILWILTGEIIMEFKVFYCNGQESLEDALNSFFRIRLCGLYTGS